MKVAIGSDQRGIDRRRDLMRFLDTLGHSVDDCGTHSAEAVDYPDIAAEVARRVASGDAERGILFCGTGIGVSIAANKIAGIRAAVCHDLHTAEMSRRHNDANVFCASADQLSLEQAQAMIELWLKTEFDGGRHARRVDKISELDRSAASDPRLTS